MKNLLILIVLVLFFASSAIAQTVSNSSNQKKDSNYTYTVVDNTPAPKTIPEEWFKFQPRKIPFIPFYDFDYKKMYETPVDISLYAGPGRAYNPNYKPYYPEKYLYVTDYSFKNFLKYSKTYKERAEWTGFRSQYERDLNYEYNDWFWNKIRSDFKRTHGMYNATVTDYRGIKHKITWEDGGIVSIYEQRKLYYEYARFYREEPKESVYKFIQNFRMPYLDVRVNSPFIEFAAPPKSYSEYKHNGLEIILHSPKHDFRTYTVPYEDKYQDQKPNGGVLEYDEIPKHTSYRYVGPDGEFYYD